MKHVIFVDSTVSGLLAFQAAKRMGCYVTFIRQKDASFLTISIGNDESKLKPHLEFVDQFLEVESLDGEEFHDLLVRLNEKRPIDALLSTSEAGIVPVAREAEHFNLRYPSLSALNNAVQKNQLRETLKKNGIRSPEYQVLSEEQLVSGVTPHIELPFVVKPTRGFAKQFSAICYTSEDFETFIKTLREGRAESDRMIDTLVSRDYLVEEYIDGSLHSAEVIVQNGIVQVYATTVRFRSVYSEMLEMTATMPSGLNADERNEIKEYVQSIFSALKLDVGLYHVELLRDEKGPCLVEINARMMGSVAPQMYRMITDIDPFELLIRLHLDEPISINDSVLTRAGTVVTIASRHGGAISNDYNQARFEKLLKSYNIDFCSAWVKPGQKVNVYTGNIGTIGHVIVLGDDPYEVARKGHRFLCELDEIYGLELAKYFE
ncbi:MULTISPECIES: ATP-grasp domain-containing protein [Dickeya]|uniref:ATP-grasp domain-containing protein n=1 Tax=Dickeya TaxID=204037 RepID=UPI00204E6953|nr:MULTISPECIES: ATP-grasp domain-containing protein [Dickeya]MCO7254453.1 ATP-grasp domain-containing protein [Dickeya oryzae]UPT55817.1 ATP-grasp domain-containing protein [Dickeya zeae]